MNTLIFILVFVVVVLVLVIFRLLYRANSERHFAYEMNRNGC